VSREDLGWIGAVVVLLIAGLLVGQRFMDPPQDAGAERTAERAGETQVAENPERASAFRHWLWEKRGLDLAVQVGLIFVGSLGIAALLPRSREDEGG
jgi:hypothetical protein